MCSPIAESSDSRGNEKAVESSTDFREIADGLTRAVFCEDGNTVGGVDGGGRAAGRAQTVFGQLAQGENGRGDLQRTEADHPGAGPGDHVQELRRPVAAPRLLLPGLRDGRRGRGRPAALDPVLGVRVQDNSGLGGPGTGDRGGRDGHHSRTVRPAVRRGAGRSEAGHGVRSVRSGGAREEPQELRVRALRAPGGRAEGHGPSGRRGGRGHGHPVDRVVGQTAGGQADPRAGVARPGAAHEAGERRREAPARHFDRLRPRDAPVLQVRPLRIRLRVVDGEVRGRLLVPAVGRRRAPSLERGHRGGGGGGRGAGHVHGRRQGRRR